jgi:hypothetical protein
MSQAGIINDEISNTIKDPDDWVTGDEEMTGAQRSYLQTLADEAGEEVDLNLTKAEASKRIEELQQKNRTWNRSVIACLKVKSQLDTVRWY